MIFILDQLKQFLSQLLDIGLIEDLAVYETNDRYIADLSQLQSPKNGHQSCSCCKSNAEIFRRSRHKSAAHREINHPMKSPLLQSFYESRAPNSVKRRGIRANRRLSRA